MTGEAPKINSKFNSEIIKNRILENSIPITESGCWIWLNGVDKDGYGVISINNKTVRSHRVSYQIFNKKIPKGLLVCHKCDIPSCVNPKHLFIGTIKDNSHDSLEKGRHWQVNKISCPYGHNDYIKLKRGGRYCKTCNRERGRKRIYNPQKRRERYLRSNI